MTGEPGWFLFDGIVKLDLETGGEERYAFADGVFGSETPMAPRPRRHGRGRRLPRHLHHRHGRDRSECWSSTRAHRDGPIARVALPERIASGTHSCWAPAETLPGF